MEFKLKYTTHPSKKYEWIFAHRPGARLGDYYEYDTEAEAQRVKEICYPESNNEWVRVVEIVS